MNLKQYSPIYNINLACNILTPLFTFSMCYLPADYPLYFHFHLQSPSPAMNRMGWALRTLLVADNSSCLKDRKVSTYRTGISISIILIHIHSLTNTTTTTVKTITSVPPTHFRHFSRHIHTPT